MFTDCFLDLKSTQIIFYTDPSNFQNFIIKIPILKFQCYLILQLQLQNAYKW